MSVYNKANTLIILDVIHLFFLVLAFFIIIMLFTW